MENTSNKLSKKAQENLFLAGKWSFIPAAFAFISILILFTITLGLVFAGSSSPLLARGGTGPVIISMLILLGLTALLGLVAWNLFKFTTSAVATKGENREDEIKEAISSLKKYFIFSGIATIIFLVLGLLAGLLGSSL